MAVGVMRDERMSRKQVKLLRVEADRRAREAAELARLNDERAAAGLAERMFDLREELAGFAARIREAEAEVAVRAAAVAAVEGTDRQAANVRAALRARWVAALNSVDSIRAAEGEIAVAVDDLAAQAEVLRARGHKIGKFDPAVRDAERAAGLRGQLLRQREMSFPVRGEFDDWLETVKDLAGELADTKDRARAAEIRRQLAGEGLVPIDGGWHMALPGELAVADGGKDETR